MKTKPFGRDVKALKNLCTNNVLSVNDQYKPINQCNVLCKAIISLLANRLKKILHKLISQWQSRFV